MDPRAASKAPTTRNTRDDGSETEVDHMRTTPQEFCDDPVEIMEASEESREANNVVSKAIP